MSKKLLTTKKRKTMKNNEMIIQKTNKELDEIFNRNRQSEVSKDKSDFEKKIKSFRKKLKKAFGCDLKKINDYSYIAIKENVEGCENFSMLHYFNFRPKEQLAPLILAGLKLAENLIMSVNLDTLNLLNWYDILSTALDCKSDYVYNFVLDKFKLEDNEQYREEFKIGYDSISNSLYNVTCESDCKAEIEFLKKFIDNDTKNCDPSWNSFTTYISSSALNLIKDIIRDKEVEEYLS